MCIWGKKSKDKLIRVEKPKPITKKKLFHYKIEERELVNYECNWEDYSQRYWKQSRKGWKLMKLLGNQQNKFPHRAIMHDYERPKKKSFEIFSVVKTLNSKSHKNKMNEKSTKFFIFLFHHHHHRKFHVWNIYFILFSVKFYVCV